MPRRNTPTATAAPATGTRPQTAEQIAALVENMPNVIETGMVNSSYLADSMVTHRSTAMLAITATRNAMYHNQALDFELITGAPSLDLERIIRAIEATTTRSRFR